MSTTAIHHQAAAWAFGAAILATGLFGAPKPAHACGSCECAPEGSRLRPGLTRDAPTNYRPLVVLGGGAVAEDIAVTDAAGATVAHAVEPVDAAGRAVWLSGVEPWRAGETYAVALGDQTLGDFEVVAGTDTSPPTLQDAALRPGEGSSAACTVVRGGQLLLSGLSDDRAYELTAVLEIDGQTLVMDVVGERSQRVYGFGDGLSDVTCLGLAQAKLTGGAPLAANLQVFDQAGNATAVPGLGLSQLGEIGAATCGDPMDSPMDSPTGEPADADAGAADGQGAGDSARADSGCSVATGGGGGGAAPLGLLALALLLRRRRTAPQSFESNRPL